MEDITLNKPLKKLDNGQFLVEIEAGIWVDFDTYKPKSDDRANEVIPTIKKAGDDLG